MSETDTDQDDARALHAEGISLLQKHQPIAAVGKLLAAATATPSAEIFGDLAVAWQMSGKPAMAQQTLQQAVLTFPASQPPRCNLAKMLALQNHAEDALQLFTAIPEDELTADSHVARALILYKLSRRKDAIRDLEFARARKPKALPLRHMLAKCYNAEGCWQLALDCITEAEAIVASHPEKSLSVQHFLMKGWALMYLKETHSAIAAFNTVLKREPENDTAEEMLARIYCRKSLPVRALYFYNRLIARHPDKTLYHDGAAQALLDMQYYGDAVRHLQVVLNNDPDNIPAACRLGDALSHANHIPEARSFMEALIQRHPDKEIVWLTKGDADLLSGDTGAARASYYKAMACTPSPRTYCRIANCGEELAKGSALRAGAEGALNTPGLHPEERADLHLTLAKACHKEKNYAEAFRHLTAGNAEKRSVTDYDERKHLQTLLALRQSCGWAETLRPASPGNKGPRPIFIVGMPRSGTTLTEQILASHTDVYGAGELTQMQIIPGQYLPADRGKWRTVPQAVMDKIGAEYMRYIRALAPEARCIVDKLPVNGVNSGIILRALPNARIIWIERDIMDCCFSCYQQLFGGNLPYVYDQAELGRYARSFTALMQHWEEELPEDRFMHIRYEDLVASPEEKMRQLIAFCGLDWQEQCLHFEKTKRVVLTVSTTQVRKPLDKNTGGKWKPYADKLATLQAALRGELPLPDAAPGRPAAVAGGPAAVAGGPAA